MICTRAPVDAFFFVSFLLYVPDSPSLSPFLFVLFLSIIVLSFSLLLPCSSLLYSLFLTLSYVAMCAVTFLVPQVVVFLVVAL